MPRCDDKRNGTGERGVPREQPRQAPALRPYWRTRRLADSADCSRRPNSADSRRPWCAARSQSPGASSTWPRGSGRSASACRINPARATAASPTVRGQAIPPCSGSPSGTWPPATPHREILEDADVDWRTRERLRLTFDNVTAALAPTNDLLTNPESWKEVIDTGSQSLRPASAICSPTCTRRPSCPPASTSRPSNSGATSPPPQDRSCARAGSTS